MGSQSPFSSGEVFHIGPVIMFGIIVTVLIRSLNPLLVAGKYST